MKLLTALFVLAVGILSADSDFETEICDKSPNCKVCKRRQEAIAMEGDRYDNALSNGANRAAENGNPQREQELLNREQSAEQRQDQREDTESARTGGRR